MWNGFIIFLQILNTILHCRSIRRDDCMRYGRMRKMMMVSFLVGLQLITVTGVRVGCYSREAGMHD